MPTLHTNGKQRGFALVEALVSMLVLASGMLGMAGFGVNLSRNAELAKQRTEATRLAQDKMEDLRTYQQVVTGAGKVAYRDLAGSSDTPATTSNTAFARSWALGGLATDDRRLVTVAVRWNDRTGEAHSVVLNSMLAAAEAADVGKLVLRPVFAGGFYRPQDRNLDIPIDAVTIPGTGKSTLAWAGASGGYLLFSNSTGGVLAKCTAQPTASNTTATTNPTGCTTAPFTLVTGYISGQTLPKSPTEPQVLFNQTEGVVGTPECVTTRTIDDINNKERALKAFRTWSCLVQLDATRTPLRWTGRITLRGPFTDGLQTGDRICRYVYDKNRNGIVDNEDHPEKYVDVAGTLDDQNFVIMRRNGNSPNDCPVGAESQQVI